jgi:predicted negative regulator of RcsB-dependent stress response
MADHMMTDDEQLENVKAWFSENGTWLAGGVLLGAVLLFGYRYYNGHKDDEALKAAARFTQMSAAMEKNDRSKAKGLAGELKKDFPDTPYADQADLMLARLSVDGGELANAVEPLTRVMNNSHDEDLRNIARLRLARVLIDQKKPDEAINLLATVPAGSFAARMYEVRGDARYAKNDLPGAIKEYQSALGLADSRGIERGLLELKLTDLGVTPAPPAQTASAKVAP